MYEFFSPLRCFFTDRSYPHPHVHEPGPYPFPALLLQSPSQFGGPFPRNVQAWPSSDNPFFIILFIRPSSVLSSTSLFACRTVTWYAAAGVRSFFPRPARTKRFSCIIANGLLPGAGRHEFLPKVLSLFTFDDPRFLEFSVPFLFGSVREPGRDPCRAAFLSVVRSCSWAGFVSAVGVDRRVFVL